MLLNPSPIRRFYWYEPFAFSRARAATETTGRSLRLMVILSVLFAAPLLIADFPTSYADLAVVALIALGSAFLVSYVLLPLVSRLPSDISVMTDSFVIGRERIPFFDVKDAVVGHTVISEHSFPVLSFTTKGGQRYLYGISAKVNPQELADFLARVGVREPHA